MIRKEILSYTHNKNLEELTIAELYNAIIKLTNDRISNMPHVSGNRKIYYMSAEFLMGKLLTNNLMNLRIYDEVNSVLREFNTSISDMEDYDPELSLGNGGLGRLAACFLDSIATLGINGEGLGLNYHYGLFKQVFANNSQQEEKDPWLDKTQFLRKTETVFPVKLNNLKLDSRMYEIDILGYQGKKTTLRLFDLETVNEKLVEKGIKFNQELLSENLTLFLYPDDSTEAGLRLRFAQQYFMVVSGISYILDIHKNNISELDKHVVIQINDTHPSMSIVYLIKRLLQEGIEFDKAVKIVSNTFAYTNHTILAEALEKWPLEYFTFVDKELVEIIKRLNEIVKACSDDKKVELIDENELVHMASLSIHFSFSVNGVAALHTEILTKSELKEFYNLYPERFNNKTNGITFRRWLLFSNPMLTDYLTNHIGESFKTDALELKRFIDFAEDAVVQNDILDIKHQQKIRLHDYILRTENRKINVDSIFDIQIKRLHEYKRQQMNMLYIINLMQRIKKGYVPARPVTFFFGSKAAPGYVIAKDIIHTILTLSNIIKKDELVSKYIDVVFVENYNVTKAEYLIPACDVSEQISLASKEASGTGNMKLMLNGALTIGTLDGANVEIAELVGKDNIYIFGKHSDEIIEHYEKRSYSARDYYEGNSEIKDAVDYIVSVEMINEGSTEHLTRLHNELITKDWFMTLIDFKDYRDTKDKMFNDYENRREWAKKMIVNISKAGFFSSDRTIAEYDKTIWKTNR